MNKLSEKQLAILLISLLVAAICGIIYELIISTISSYLLGNSVYQFSITIGFFMFAMGIGSMATKYFNARFIENFIYVEIGLAFFGGLAGIILFLAFPYARGLYELINITLIFIIGALVGMEIPLITTAMSQIKSTKNSIADVMSFDYVGALIGSLVFPIYLLPKLGLIESSFVVGFANLIIAIITTFFFWKTIEDKNLVRNLLFSTAGLLMAGIIFSNHLTQFAEKHLYFDQIVYSEQTNYQQLTFTRSKINQDHRLYIDGHIQFSSRDEYRYHEYLVHPVMSLPGKRERVLLLGGGDGLALREILKYEDVTSVVLVDLDPKMIEFGRVFPTMRRLNLSAYDDERVQAIAQDAFVYLNQPLGKFDRVIIDMPDPHNEAINKLYSLQFYEMVRRVMTPEGLMATQSSSPFFTRHVYWSIAETLKESFSDIESYQFPLPSFGIWGFHIASNTDADLGTVEFNINTKAISAKSLMAAQVFSKDISRPSNNIKVNSIMAPSLYITYAEEMSY